MNKSFIIVITLLILTSCTSNKNNFDASGTFETEETIVSVEASGTILELNVQEGQVLEAGQFIGYVDTTQLFLRKKQLQAQIQSILSQKPDVSAQLGSVQAQLRAAEKEQQRFTRLVDQDAAPRKQLDDITAQVNVLKEQIEAQRSSLQISSESLTQQTFPLKVQIDQINDQLAKSKIINPVGGSVIATYVEEKEMATTGKPLYKIADLTYLTLRAYLTGDQLPLVRLNQQVTVLIDSTRKEYKKVPGTVTWISDQSEFTPKSIQTKDERANLVYAIKIRVKNDGTLKTGMYAEVKF